MLRWIMRNPALGSEEDAGQFGSKFLFGLVQIAEAVRVIQGLAVQPRRVAGPVCEFMKRRAVIALCLFERSFWRKMNAVIRPAVIGAVILIVRDFGSGCRENRLARFRRLELGALWQCVRGNIVDLPGIEYGIDAMDVAGPVGLGPAIIRPFTGTGCLPIGG